MRRALVERLRWDFPSGARVELVRMGDDPSPRAPKPGDRGTVRTVDSAGTIHVMWDSGVSLGVLYGVDEVRRIDF